MNKPNVPAVENAIRILHEIAEKSGETTSSALARRLGASQPTTYRILKTLESADWIRADESGGYRLSIGMLPLLTHLDDFTRYRRIAQPILDGLSRSLELTVKFSLRQGLEQIIVATSHPRKPFSVSVPLGGRFPIVWGSPGACLLAGLSKKEIDLLIERIPEDSWKHETPKALKKRLQELHKTGSCKSIGEHYLSIDTVSVKLDTDSTPSALTLVALRGELTERNLPRCREELKQSALELAAALR
ncbi:IclR family transcriptional regulator [Pelagicoccus sp. SDUM812005]|uniref:IclR family transcriptional regulator n=1 Tax=Pelagicoccus sp. SDUM812005 TaxID=3041257 RepID=UPI00280DB3DB|nr:IclR family transcriptional regulator [Pelagicoccus sp. SDUM812005]MDQ8181598.1 IclR family transcriptional regulator [Pelagicoccus sp. SDUM812005]